MAESSMVAATIGRFDTDDMTLSYGEWPGDSPPVILLHGITGSWFTMWQPRIALRGRQRAFAYDARGHGDSGRSTDSYRFIDYGGDAVRFVEGVVREPAILIGHSLGAMTSIFVAGTRPDLVLGAFLVDPPLYVGEFGLRDDQQGFERNYTLAGKPFEEILAGGLPENRARTLSKLDGQAVRQVLDGTAFEGWNTDTLLRQIECPVLLEHGDRELNSAIYQGELERAKGLLKNCHVLHMPETGHAPWVQQPEEFVQTVSAFIHEVVAKR